MSEDNSTVILAKEGSRRQVQYLNKSCAEWVRWKLTEYTARSVTSEERAVKQSLIKSSDTSRRLPQSHDP